MNRLLFWSLFALGVALAAWLPLTREYPELPAHFAYWLTVVRL